MKTKLLTALLALSASLAFQVQADPNFNYMVNLDGTITITGFQAPLPAPPIDLTIPASYAGYTVSAIGDSAFARQTGITSVSIAPGVNSIGAMAFSGDSGISSVDIPGTVSVIYDAAFSGCSKLTDLTINDGVTVIGPYAFCDCSSLTSVNVPDSVSTVGELAFADCTELASITFGTGLSGMGGYVFNDDTHLMSLTFKGNAPVTLQDFDPVEGTPYGYDNPFAGLPAGATIYYYMGASGWPGVYNPNRPFELGGPSGPFDGVKTYELFPDWQMAPSPDDSSSFQLTAYNSTNSAVPSNGGYGLYVPANINGTPVVSIGSAALFNASLTNIIISASITNLGDYALANNPHLTNLIFTGTAPALGSNVFDGAANNATVQYLSGLSGWNLTFGGLPTTSLSITPEGFQFAISNNVAGITGYSGGGGTVTFPKNIFGYSVNSINGIIDDPQDGPWCVIVPDNIAHLSDYAFSACPNLTNVTLGDGVTDIGAYAFANATALSGLTLGRGVTSVGDYAFQGCSGLTNIMFLGDAPTAGSNVFADVNPGAVVYYYPGASGWGASFGNLPTVPLATTPDGFGFVANADGTATITSYSGLGGVVNFPATVYGRPVTAINGIIDDPQDGPWIAMIPSSVLTIGTNAFEGCTNLTGVSFGVGMTNIEAGAFKYCSSLTNITFSGNAPRLGAGVFTGIGQGAAVHYYPGGRGWSVIFGGLPVYGKGVATLSVQLSQERTLLPSRNFNFTINGARNYAVGVEASTNLVNWQLVWSGMAGSFTDLQSTNYTSRFYRVRLPLSP